ncbi:PREDICTED: uncharacterized protein LOC109126869 [Camelina sativa]|uniref:ATP-dependent DNA helicase n=1 Tax=Camelina sativa TaxID=90675 RepID=A0ABM1QHR3_CAMSA|nr:PREDICTED: uncharacterized protein LOC109126869 [Camelina sativa]
MPKLDNSLIDNNENMLLRDKRNYNCDDQREDYDRLLSMSTDEQKSVYLQIIDAVNRNKGGMFFVHGFGGTGKTFLWSILGADIRSRDGIVLNVASSGIAALLMEGGDFGQSLPVVLEARRVGTVLASINSSLLWDSCRVLQLTQNMRLCRAVNSQDADAISTFSKWLLDIGDGKINDPNNREVEIEIPADLLIMGCDDPVQAIVIKIYGNSFARRTAAKIVCERAILSPRNDDADKIIQSQLPGEERQYLSSDSIKTSDKSAYDDMIYTQEFINNVEDKRRHESANNSNEVVITMLNGRNETFKCRAKDNYVSQFMYSWELNGCHLIYKSEPGFCVMRL